ncbi:MAG: hypothetical protein Q9201_005105 [Fulgogasparrea decipioides]
MQNGNSLRTPLPSSDNPIFGLWQPNIQLKHLFYGDGCVSDHLRDILPTPFPKVFVVTGQSLATKTPLVKELENLFGEYHAATFSGIRQHGPFADVDAALETVLQDDSIDTILLLGGGSPIDSAKTISYRVSETKGTWLTHITIPTTLSATECTAGGTYMKPDGVKVGFMAPEMAVKAIFYDPYYASFTLKELWLTTGIRAMDHAVECFYHPYASEIWKAQSIELQIAAFLSSGLKGSNLKGGMGLLHSLGYALGSPYGIPHGITSCLTLGRIVKMKAQASKDDAKQIARLLPKTGAQYSGDVVKDACEVGDRILKLIDDLAISPGTLSERGVSRDEIMIIVGRTFGYNTENRTYNKVLHTARERQEATMQFRAEQNGWTKFISMRYHYNLLYREEEREMNKFCKETGVGLIPWAPLSRGAEDEILCNYRHTESEYAIIKRVQKLAEKKEGKMSTVSLVWLNKRVSSPIVGFSSVERVDDALAARGKELTEEEEKYLEEPYVTRDIQGHS